MTQDPTSPTVVASAPTEMEAAVIAALLRENGIDATLVGAFTSAFKAEAPGEVSVVVPRDQAIKARQLLDAAALEADAADDPADDDE